MNNANAKSLEKILPRFVRIILLVAAVAHIILFIVTALSRIAYPFELEWMEGASVVHVHRILSGKSLYVRPSPEFIPFIYPPFYFYASSIVALITGAEFFPLRLISFLSTLGAMTLVFLFVRKENGSLKTAVVGAGLFAATYVISGFWLDIARVDSLFLFLILGACYLTRFHVTVAGYAFAAILFTLAFLTKQTALVIMVPVIFYPAVIGNWKRFFQLSITTLILTAGSVVILNLATEGWFGYYIFRIPRGHSLIYGKLLGFWFTDFLPFYFIAFIFGMFFLYSEWRNREKKRCFYLLLAAGMTLSSWLSRLHSGGWLNVMIPVLCAFSITGALGYRLFLEHIRKNIKRESRRILYTVIIHSALAVQLIMLVYNPARQRPGRKDIQAGNRIIEIIRKTEGEVYIPFHSWLAEMAGKQSYVHTQCLMDVLRSDRDIENNPGEALLKKIQNRDFSLVIVDNPGFMDTLNNYYSAEKIHYPGKETFYPVTGMKTRPYLAYRPPDVNE